MLVLGGQLKLYGCVYTFTCTTSAFAYKTALFLNQDTCILLMYILYTYNYWMFIEFIDTLPKTDIFPQNQGLEDEISFWGPGYFRGHVRLRGVSEFQVLNFPCCDTVADLWDTLTVHGRLSRMCSCVGMAQQVAVEAGMSVHPRKLTSFHVSFPG